MSATYEQVIDRGWAPITRAAHRLHTAGYVAFQTICDVCGTVLLSTASTTGQDRGNGHCRSGQRPGHRDTTGSTQGSAGR